MRILIFGAAGFIGSNITRYATTQDHDVVAFCRSGSVNGFKGSCVRWSLGDQIDEDWVNGATCAIHLAHDFAGPAEAAVTVNATVETARWLHGHGVARQIFFSSYSSGEHATSLYGRSKSAIEKGLRDYPEVVIVRPGLVIGDGGIYGRIRGFATRFPIIPLPDGGRGTVPIIDIGRLCAKTISIATSVTVSREFNLFEARHVTLRQLVLQAAAEKGKRPWIVPVPSLMVAGLLRAAVAFGFPLPVNADNLEGFLANQRAKYSSSLEDMTND